MKANPNWSLFTKYINEECNAQEKATFKLWLSLNEDNQKWFSEMKEAWDAYDNNQASFDTNKVTAWKEISGSINKKATKTKSLIIWTNRIAASLIFLIGILYVVNYQLKKADIQYLIVATSGTNLEVKKVVLPDSTIVWLNKGTTIKYPEFFLKNERHILLDGEAFFEVSRNEKKPFVIESQKTFTRVLGTSFNLRAYDNEKEVEIIVNSGKVSFSSKSDEHTKVILTKDFAGLYNTGNGKILKSSNFDINYQSWKTGKLFFFKTKFSNVCQTLERHYGKKIELADPELENMEMSATFNNQKFTDIIDLIAQTLEINYQVNNDKIIFSKK